jgi:luciferase-like monooxygenase
VSIKRDMGHIHGEKLADLPFLIKLRKEILPPGTKQVHRFLEIKVLKY